MFYCVGLCNMSYTHIFCFKSSCGVGDTGSLSGRMAVYSIRNGVHGPEPAACTPGEKRRENLVLVPRKSNT